MLSDFVFLVLSTRVVGLPYCHAVVGQLFSDLNFPTAFVYLLSVSPGLCCVDLGTPSAGHDSLPDFVAADPDLV